MKERPNPPRKTQIRVVSRSGMTAAERASFDKAVDALLAELVRRLDRRNEGEADGITEEQVAGATRRSRRSAK